MCVYIGIEDLVANALIELIEINQERKVLFKNLDKYGAMVIKCLNKDEEKAILILSKERTDSFLHDYSDLFELYCDNGKDDGIQLKDNVTVAQLWDVFRSYLATDVLLAFKDKAAVAELGVEVA